MAKDTRRDRQTNPVWKQNRPRVFVRDGFQCRLCGLNREEHYEEHRRDLPVHHIRKEIEFGDVDEAHRMSNMVVLCTDCHNSLENLTPSRQREILGELDRIEGTFDFETDHRTLLGNMDGVAYSIEEMLADVRQVADIVDGEPSKDEQNEYGQVSLSALINRFGSWIAAKKEAGVYTGDIRKVSKQQLIDDIQRVYDVLGHAPTYTEYEVHGYYSSQTFTDKFGSFTVGRREAGISDDYVDIPKDRLVDDINRVNEVVDGPVSSGEYKELGKYHITTLYRHFGSWVDARQAARIDGEPTRRPPMKRKKNDILRDVRGLWMWLDKDPTVRDYNDYGKFSQKVIYSRFDGWEDLKKQAGVYS